MTGGGPVLRDIHVPPEPAWWPPAPGWWLVIVLLAGMLAWTAWRLYRRARRARARRVLREEFERIRRDHPSAGAAAQQVAALSELLRRAARRHAPEALTLKDEAWLAYLDRGEPRQPFSRGPGRLLLDGPYRPRVAAEDADALADVVRARLDRFVAVRDA
jgi:hypothetical protein